jgi:hypothetical protein
LNRSYLADIVVARGAIAEHSGNARRTPEKVGASHKRKKFMERSVIACLLLAFAGLLVAQEVPKADLFLGYSFVRNNSVPPISAYTSTGGLGGFAWNFNEHVAGEAQLGGYHSGNVEQAQFATTTFDYLFGLRISVGRTKTVDPWGHALAGGQAAWNSVAVNSPLVINPLAAPMPPVSRYNTSQNAFAAAVGAGLDLRLSRHILCRPLQIDYLRSKFAGINVTVPSGINGSRFLNNVRYAAGIVFTFGTSISGP